jgi:hypothetical protein
MHIVAGWWKSFMTGQNFVFLKVVNIQFSWIDFKPIIPPVRDCKNTVDLCLININGSGRVINWKAIYSGS